MSSSYAAPLPGQSVPVAALGAAAVAAAVASGAPPPVAVSLVLSIVGYKLTSSFLSSGFVREAFIKARLTGIDLNKPETKRDADGNLIRPIEGPIVPEATGVLAGTVYLTVMFLFIPVRFVHESEAWGGRSGGWGAASAAAAVAAPSGSFPLAHLSKFLCSLLAICCMCFLGFADNVLDLRWRDKLWLPLCASLPLLVVYAVDGGGTTVIVPRLLAPLLGGSIQLGVAYYFFMACLAIFCTNAINILAGVNGLEVGQSVVIAATVIVNNLIQLWRWPSGPLHDNNLFSLYLMLPFLGCSVALMQHNWFPARVFVGDTYCYFAGMTFAVAGILGHNSKTLLLFFVPQILNFIYSVPQLFKLVPCPRHRMPGFDAKTNRLTMSYAEFSMAELRAPGRLVVRACAALRLGSVHIDASTQQARASAGARRGSAAARHELRRHAPQVRMSNMTIINYALYVCGPMREDRLTLALLGVQAACSALALLVRYQLAYVFYDIVK